MSKKVTDFKPKANNEVKVEKKELSNLMALERSIPSTLAQVGENRVRYLRTEAKMMDEVKFLENKMSSTIQQIKEKYKIVGRIKAFDPSKSSIIVE